MLQLACRVHGIDIDLDQSGTQVTVHGDGKRQNIGTHQGDAIALLQSQTGLQPGGITARQAIHIVIAKGCAVVVIGGTGTIPGQGRLDQVNQGPDAIRVNRCGDMCGIGFPPYGFHICRNLLSLYQGDRQASRSPSFLCAYNGREFILQCRYYIAIPGVSISMCNGSRGLTATIPGKSTCHQDRREKMNRPSHLSLSIHAQPRVQSSMVAASILRVRVVAGPE